MEKYYKKTKSIKGVLIIIRVVLFLFVFHLCMPTLLAQAKTIGTVTANVLNIRKSPSTSSTILGKLPKGTKVSISSQSKDSQGALWYQINAPVNGKNVIGYVSASFIKKTTSTSKSTPVSTYAKRYGKMNTSVNIRKSYTTSSKSLGSVKQSTTVRVLGVKSNGGSKWYFVQTKIAGNSVNGYVRSDLMNLYPTTVKTTKYQLGQANVKINLYKTANTSDSKLGIISKNQEFIIRGGLKVYKTNWMKVVARINGKDVAGYVLTSKTKNLPSTANSSSSDDGYTKIPLTGRRIPSMIASSRGSLVKGAKVTVLGAVTVSGTQWYECKYIASGKSKTGYIKASQITITDNADFETSIASFPSSYKPALRKLNQTYPNWKFVPVNVGLNWDTVIENQTKPGRNTISSTVPSNGTSGIYSAPFSYLSTASGAYDWSTDTYKLYDGKTWYMASEDVVKYYMDPRNALSTTKIFQFESLAYNASMSKNVVTTIFKGTFMNGTYSYVTGNTNNQRYYNDSIMTAGKLAGVSPYFLAARMRQELGTTRSGSVTGSYPGYEGYYNYYNIGANDSPGGGAIANGLKFAKSGTTYDRPWDNPYKSIIGGAKYIGSSYIQKGQNTLYFQKFSVVNSKYYYWHQYMTNIQAPTSESNTAYNAYNNYGILRDKMIFYIPVYNNMPSSVCTMPAASGNPNSYLKSLVVKNGSKTLSFNKTFSYDMTSYNVVVPSGVNSISVSATAVSKYAKGISNTGTHDISGLGSGQSKKITVKCTAGNGTTKAYTVNVTRATK